MGPGLAPAALRARSRPPEGTAAGVGLDRFVAFANSGGRVVDRFGGGRVTPLFGGVKLDLREAVPPPDGATLETGAAFGGVEVHA